MSPLTDERAIDLLRDSLERHCGNALPDRQYFWESILASTVAWNDEEVIRDLFGDDEFCVIFDPNPWVVSARKVAARHAGLTYVPLGYRVSGQELKELLRQPWMIGEDFYLIDADENFFGMRTHEDPGSQRGIWLPSENA